MRIAVTGGTGFIGGALLDLAASRGIEVRALTRRPQAKRTNVIWCAGDLATPAALTSLVQGVDAVIHLAGTVSALDRATFEAGNVAGSQALLEAAAQADVGRFVFVSSLAAREPSLSLYGASKAAAEDLVRASSISWTIVRPPAVYGPRDRDMLELFRAAKWGVVPMPREGRASLIHAEDLARLLLSLAVAADEEVAGKVLEPDDGRPGGWRHSELGTAIGQAVGRKVRVIGLSPRTLGWAARLDTAVRRTRAKLTPDRASYMAHPDWAVSNGASVPPTLWRPQIETSEGLRDTAEWYREQGWL